MIDKLDRIVDATVHAASLIAGSAAKVDPVWAALGVVLYLVSQAVRTRGWHTIVRASYPDAHGLRARDTCCAYLAGAGLNGVIPARGGDVVKLAMLHRRIEGASYATLAATFLPETLFETVVAVGLVAWALANGFLPIPLSTAELPAVDVSLIVNHPILSAGVVAALLVFVTWLARLVRRRAEDLALRVSRGMVILGTPRRFVTGVAGWQALGRVIRLLSLAAFLAAFQLPVTPATVVLVMAAQGGGRIIPLAPASTGLRLAMLSYGFVEVTGQAVDIAKITVFTFGVGAVVLAAGLLVSAVILAREYGTLSPRRAVLAARAVLARREVSSEAATG
jgi:uncharacterized membrane protein YbhN (UPF0104 family)